MSNVIKKLNSNKIKYIFHSYKHEEGNINYAQEAVEKLGIGEEKVYKTLVLESEKKYYMAVLCSKNTLSLKKIASLIGNKKAVLAIEKDVERVTGYFFGGVSPIVVGKKQLKVFLDQTSLMQETIFVSAGKKGEEIEIKAQDLADLVGGKFRDIIT